MAEPDNLVLEILRDIRGDIRQVDGKIDALDRRMSALEDRVDTVEIKLDGLTHAMLSGFGSLVREMKDINERMTALEAERA